MKPRRGFSSPGFDQGKQSEHDRRRALYLEASHRQGGHSERGGEIADELGTPFPLTMPNLEKAAKRDGFDPKELWPWLAPMRGGKTS